MVTISTSSSDRIRPKTSGVREAHVVGQQRAGQPGDGGRDHEGQHLM